MVQRGAEHCSAGWSIEGAVAGIGAGSGVRQAAQAGQSGHV